MKHPRLMAALLGLLLALPTLTLTAQDAGWPVETRCVGEPTTPPAAWTFPGTILMMGNFGIHAVQAGWETPHVVAFVHDRASASAGLSPDGHWYAALEAHGSISPYNPVIYSVEEIGITVYSTKNLHEEYYVPWHNSYGGIINLGRPDEYPQMFWMNNRQILYINRIQGNDVGGAIINPFTREREDYSEKFLPWMQDYLQPSPDWSFIVYEDSLAGGWILSDGEINRILNRGSPEIHIIWKLDSSSFAGVTAEYNDGVPQYDLRLYDNSGDLTDVIGKDKLAIRWAYFSDTITIAWNSNGRYLAYIAGDKKELHIADTQTKTVRNLCVTIDSLSWSPDGKQLALLKLGYYPQRQQPVTIFDLESNELYTVAYHSGSIIGWRED